MLVRKNICIAINSLEMGGAEKQSVLLAEALKPFHNIVLVVVDPQKKVYPPRMQTLKHEDIETVFLKKNLLRKIGTFTSILKKKKIEFIFSFLATDTVLSTVCGLLTKVPYIFGGLRSSSWPKFKLLVLRANHNYFLTYTIANNFAGYQAAIDYGFNQNVLVIPNGIEIRPLQPKIKSPKTINIISMGRLVKPKRYDIAIKTIMHLKTIIKANCNINYKIVGQGPEYETISSLIDKYKVGKEVEIINGVSDVYSLLDKSDIYLCTSSFEGISNSLMEAMNCALPIVATDTGDNSRLVLDNESGYLAPVNNYVMLAEKLDDLIKSPTSQELMGRAGYRHLIKNFGFKTFQKKYLDLIANVENIEICKGEFTFRAESDK